MHIHKIIRAIAICSLFCLSSVLSANAAPSVSFGLRDQTPGQTLIQTKKLTPQDAKRISAALKRVTAIRKRHGAKHQLYAKALFDLASLYERVGQKQNALRYYKAAHGVYRTALGEKHPQTVRTLAKMRALGGTARKRRALKKVTPKGRGPDIVKKSFEYKVPPKGGASGSRLPGASESAGKGGGSGGGLSGGGTKRRSFSYKKKNGGSGSAATRKEPTGGRRALARKPAPPAATPPAAPSTSPRVTAPPPPVSAPSGGDGALRESSRSMPWTLNETGDAGEDVPFFTVPVYYATDREDTGKTAPGEKYGSGRAALTYGVCYVTVPKSHDVGEIEEPRWWKFEFSASPESHIILKEVRKQNKDSFFGDMRRRVRASKSKSSFLFVHGYNTTFEAAAKRTAQMTHDLGFDGAPVFYSWPSQGTTASYTIDANTIRWAEPNLKAFIGDFVKRSNAEKIFLVAHSMGTRALTSAVSDLAEEDPTVKDKIEAIILAAPDIDAEIFKTQILPRMKGAAQNITLYASSRDTALLFSKRINGYPRAGDAGDGLVIAQGLDTIDASKVDTSLIGHSYFAQAESLLKDLYTILTQSSRAADRETLVPVEDDVGRYWRLR